MESTVIVQDVFNITGIGVVPAGVVKTGTLQIGMVAMINGKKAIVKTIEMRHQELNEAHGGDRIGFSLHGVEKEDLTSGMILHFTNEGTPRASVNAIPQAKPIHPKGFLSRLFRR